MSDIKFWDPVDAGNQDAAPDGWPEGQPAGTLNDCGRAVQGAVRRQWEQAAWFDFNDTVTFVATDQLDISGTDLANRYHVGRRVWVTGTTTGSVYGTITNVAGDYVITVSLDSGTFSADPNLTISVGAPADNPAVDVSAVANLVFPVGVPIGSGMDWWGTAVPDSTWLFADGSALDSVADTTLATLFGIIGTTYGGTGANNFNLPDMRGRVAAGKDDMGGAAQGRLTSGSKAGIDGTQLGDSGGVEEHALDTAEIPAHSHVQVGGSNNAQGGSGVNSMSGGANIVSTRDTGGGDAHTNVQPTIICNYVIKARA